MLRSRMGDTWQIGTTSIREDHWIASGLRFVHWCHASPNVQARQNPKNDPTYLPVLECLRPAEQADPPHSTVNGFSAGSHTGAVIASAIRCLCPQFLCTGPCLSPCGPGSLLSPFALFSALSCLWWRCWWWQWFCQWCGGCPPPPTTDTLAPHNRFHPTSPLHQNHLRKLLSLFYWTCSLAVCHFDPQQGLPQWRPASQITARLGAIATPKSVLAALVATAEPDRRNYHLVHAAEDCLCDWKPTENELDMLQRSLHITYVTDSARWMGKHKHCYWHWLQCQLPTGKVSLTTLKLTHPDVVPRRDRIAAPMRLASWIRFETVMTSDDWEGAISLLVSNLHRPDQELLVLLQSCVAGQPIASMEEAQALLLKNFRVGKGNQSACAQWLTEMARDLLAPIPFRDVFVILALFLPQLTFVDETAAHLCR